MNQINVIKYKDQHQKKPGIWIWPLTFFLIAALVAASAWYFSKRRAMHPGKVATRPVLIRK
jgi:hypothetical protein